LVPLFGITLHFFNYLHFFEIQKVTVWARPSGFQKMVLKKQKLNAFFMFFISFDNFFSFSFFFLLFSYLLLFYHYYYYYLFKFKNFKIGKRIYKEILFCKTLK
jgi:hypothetical protein